MSEETVMVAIASFTYEDEQGRPGVVRRGATVRVGHPLLAGRDDLFEPFRVDYEHEVPDSPGRHAAKRAASRPKSSEGGAN